MQRLFTILVAALCVAAMLALSGCASDEQTALDARAQAAQQSDSHANMSHGWGNE